MTRRPLILAFVVVVLAAWSFGAREPAPEFLERHICVMWAANCQSFRMTVGDLVKLCKENESSSVQWEVTSEKRALFGCNEID
jgi:hypothetical protein